MRELPEPKFHIVGIPDATYTRNEVLAIQKQAYEDGLRDALPAQPEEKHLLALLRVECPAMFRDGLRNPSDGEKTAQMVEAKICKAERQYAALLTASQKEQK